MADTNNLIDIEGLSHFKAKQDIENAKKFKSKEEATDLKGAVRYDTAQVLTEQEKKQARANLGIDENGGSGGSVEGAVRYDVEQALLDEQKARARKNIGTTDGTWESMPDKPFGKTGLNYKWDGNATGLEKLSIVEGFDFYKISSDVLSEDALLGASVKSYFDGTDIEGEITQDGDITFVQTSAGNLVVMYDGQIPLMCVFSQVGEDTFATVTFTIETTGLWFLHSAGEEEYTRYLQKNYEVKKIDKEFLPEGLVTTDENGLIPASKLPSYVDDVVEGYRDSSLNYGGSFYEDEGLTIKMNDESGKIYVDLATGNTYRWSGSQYVRMNPDEYTIATNADIDALFT